MQICHPVQSLSHPHLDRRSRRPCSLFLPLLLFAAFGSTVAQTAAAPTHTFHDPTYKLSFDYPANWTFTRADHEISTFHLDARSALKTTALRGVVAMPQNPFPASTFSGAYLYFSVTPRSSAASCAKQATPPPGKPTDTTEIADIAFTRGHDEQKDICITQHDEIYTTHHHGACYRFDLAINNFCGGEVSGVKDITTKELGEIRSRLESIFSTIRFDTK